MADDLILHPEFITCRVKCQSVRDPSSDNICHPIAVRNRLRIDALFGILGWGLGPIFFIQVVSSLSFVFSSPYPFHFIFTVLLLYYSLPLFFCCSSLFHFIFLLFFFFPVFNFFFSILFLSFSSSLSYFPFIFSFFFFSNKDYKLYMYVFLIFIFHLPFSSCFLLSSSFVSMA